MILKLINKIKNIVKIARIVSVDDSADIRFGVVKYLGKEQECQIFTPYGIMSNPPENSMGPIFQIDGEESKLMGMFDRTDNRPVKNLESGEVAVGNYETGDYVKFKDGNIIEISCGGDLNITVSGTATIDGDLDVTGEVTAKSGSPATKVTLSQHVHPGTGSPPTPGT